jgi:hypothetical protein
MTFLTLFGSAPDIACSFIMFSFLWQLLARLLL